MKSGWILRQRRGHQFIALSGNNTWELSSYSYHTFATKESAIETAEGFNGTYDVISLIEFNHKHRLVLAGNCCYGG